MNKIRPFVTEIILVFYSKLSYLDTLHRDNSTSNFSGNSEDNSTMLRFYLRF